MEEKQRATKLGAVDVWDKRLKNGSKLVFWFCKKLNIGSAMPRLQLTDEHWSKLKPIMLESDIYDKSNLRTTLEGVLYTLRVRCPWRDLPTEFGRWNSVFKRFIEWSAKGKILAIFKAISDDCRKRICTAQALSFYRYTL